MSNLIDRQAVIDSLTLNAGLKDEDGRSIEDWDERKKIWTGLIGLIPSVQPEIIRCKDCKHHGTNGYRLNCAVFCCTMPDDGFCSCGERREDG